MIKMIDLMKEIKNILADKAQRIIDAFEGGRADAFIKEFQLDAVSEYYILRWFHGYATKVETPKKVTLEILDMDPISDHKFWCHTRLCIIYAISSAEEADFNWKVNWQEEDKTLRITETSIHLKQPDWKGQSKEVNLARIKENLEVAKDKTISNQMDWREMVGKHNDKSSKIIPASIFSRAAAKSVRYRSTHPQIDSAAILADMMSIRMARFAYEIKDMNEIEMLDVIHSYAHLFFQIKEYNEFKEEGSAEYSPKELSLLPLYSIDETFSVSRKQDITEVSCVDLASYYVGLLRLGGVDAQRVFVIIQPFHYLTVLKHEDQYFIISSNEVYPMNPKRLYGDTEVIRVVTPSYYIDKTGEATVSAEEYRHIEQVFHDGIPIFNLPAYQKDCSEWPVDMKEVLQINKFSSPEAYHHAIVEFVKGKDREYPNSIYTWALYAYQTLSVLQPQAYLIWSLHSQEVIRFSKKIESIDMLWEWMRENLDTGSIFEEEERIMTADQVLRNQKGGPKDKGVLFYTIIKLRYPDYTSGILLTEGNACYVEIEIDGERVVYDMTICERGEVKNTMVKLYFNDKNVFRNFMYGQT